MNSACRCKEQKGDTDGNSSTEDEGTTFCFALVTRRILSLRKQKTQPLVMVLLFIFLLFSLAFQTLNYTRRIVTATVLPKQTSLESASDKAKSIFGAKAKSSATDEAPPWVLTIVSKYLVRVLSNQLTCFIVQICFTYHFLCRTFKYVAQLSGEMGNNLGKLAHGYGLAWWLMQQHKNEAIVNIVLRHQERPKWERGRAALQKCFPNTRKLDFEAGNTQEFHNRRQEQQQKNEWLLRGEDQFSEAPMGRTESEIDEFLEGFLALRRQYETNRLDDSSSNNNNNNISLPFLYTNNLVELSAFMDRFYDDYRRLFQFDMQLVAISCRILMNLSL